MEESIGPKSIDLSSFPLLRIDEIHLHSTATLKSSQQELLLLTKSHRDGIESEQVPGIPLLSSYASRLINSIQSELLSRRVQSLFHANEGNECSEDNNEVKVVKTNSQDTDAFGGDQINGDEESKVKSTHNIKQTFDKREIRTPLSASNHGYRKSVLQNTNQSYCVVPESSKGGNRKNSFQSRSRAANAALKERNRPLTEKEKQQGLKKQKRERREKIMHRMEKRRLRRERLMLKKKRKEERDSLKKEKEDVRKRVVVNTNPQNEIFRANKIGGQEDNGQISSVIVAKVADSGPGSSIASETSAVHGSPIASESDALPGSPGAGGLSGPNGKYETDAVYATSTTGTVSGQSGTHELGSSESYVTSEAGAPVSGSDETTSASATSVASESGTHEMGTVESGSMSGSPGTYQTDAASESPGTNETADLLESSIAYETSALGFEIIEPQSQKLGHKTCMEIHVDNSIIRGVDSSRHTSKVHDGGTKASLKIQSLLHCSCTRQNEEIPNDPDINSIVDDTKCKDMFHHPNEAEMRGMMDIVHSTEQPWLSQPPAIKGKKTISIEKDDGPFLTDIYPDFFNIFSVFSGEKLSKNSIKDFHSMKACLHYQINTIASLTTSNQNIYSGHEENPIASDLRGGLADSEAFLYGIKAKNREEVASIVDDIFESDEQWHNITNWQEVGTCSSWNLLWTWEKPKINPEHLLVFQKISRFKDTRYLTRKDLLKKKLQRYANSIMPMTFVLPSEYNEFVSAFSTEANANLERENIWIMKPTSMSG
jgi:hypothetical protein